jgi:ADP-ribose pyrophosphatase YjhB (NUDIX family)
MPDVPPLLRWVRRLSAIAQSGLAFSPNEFDRQRYEELRRLAAEMAAYPSADVEAIDHLFASAGGYATPKIICRAAVFDDLDRILMVRETADGRWTVPGGWIDVGDSPAGATAREVLEETGYRVEVRRLVALYDKLAHDHPPTPHHSYLVFFLCDLVGGEPAPSYETSDIGWFPAEGLPELSTLRTTQDQIRRMFDHHLNPDLPPDFD